MTELSDLSPLQRIERCRALAADARREASLATGALREAYLIMANGWDNLADETEARLNREL